MFEGVIPGWHTTIYPYYYFSGLILSILAIVVFIWIIAFKIFNEERYHKLLNIANFAICILCTIQLSVYFFELFMAWYSGYLYEQFDFYNRAIGTYWIMYVLMLFPLLISQLFWWKKNRLNLNLALFIVVGLNLSMWAERLVIIITNLFRN